MSKCRHAAAFLVGTFLLFPTLSSAQETDPISGLDLPSFDVSVSMEVPDVSSFTDPIPGLELDVSVSVDVPEDLVEAAAKKGNLKPNPKEQVDEALESARKKGEKPNPTEAFDEALEQMNKGDLINKLEEERDLVASSAKKGNMKPNFFQVLVSKLRNAGDPIPDVDVGCCKPR